MKFWEKSSPPPPSWHPDFRDLATLPDVKVVRTSFFVNGVASLVLLLAALFLAYQELGRRSLLEDIQVLEEKIAENKSRNQEALRLHGQFQTEARMINQVADYLDSSLDLSAVLVTLAETLDSGMMFTTLRYQDVTNQGKIVGKQLLINGSIEAAPDAAASVVTDYVERFSEDPFLADRVKEAVPTSLVPTPEGDKMAFGIRLVLQGPNENKEEKK